MFRKINLAIILFSLLVFSSCKKEHPIIELPFTFEKHIVIPMVFNGDTIPAVFDTGTTRTVLNSRFFKKAQLISNDSANFYLSVGMKRVAYHKKLEIKLGSENIPVKGIVQYDDYPPVVGMDVISQYYWLFDMKKKKVLLSKGDIIATSPKVESFKIPYDLSINDGTLSTFANFGDSLKYRLFIDSGTMKLQNTNATITNGQLKIEASIYILSDQLMNHLNKRKGILGMGKKDSSNIYIHPDLTINGTKLAYQVVSSGHYKTKDYDALIPAEFFSLYDQVYINPKEKYIEFIRTDSTPNKSTKSIQEFYELIVNGVKTTKNDSEVTINWNNLLNPLIN